MGRKPTGRPPGRPKGYPAFARLAAAREALNAKAATAVKLVEEAARVAAKRGNHAPATWMLEHMSAQDEQGKEVRPIAHGIDKQQIEGGSRAPVINIGWVAAPQLPEPQAIEVKALPVPDGDVDS